MLKASLPKILFQLFIYICLSCLIPVFAVASNGATPTDLVGMWNYNSFVSGPSAPWWERGTLTVKPDGTFTGSGKDCNGNPCSPSGTFSISSDGIVMTESSCSDTPLCQIDSGNTVLVCTATDESGSSKLIIFTKRAASYSLADLVGNWEGIFLSSGTTLPGVNISNTFYPDGTYKGTLTAGDKPPAGTSGQIRISRTGAITCLSGECLSGPNNYAAFMGANKTVSVGTSGAASGQDALLSVLTRQAVSYSMVDLAGTWQGSSVASGPGAPYWERDSLTIDAEGTFAVSWTGSDGSSGAGTGTLAISPDGVITCVSGDCTDRTYMSFMDAGKTVAAGTHTWPDGATREIKIFTKDLVPNTPAEARAAAAPAGSVKVTITPAAAVKAGAKWNVDGGKWQKSGATVGKLSVGSHTVNFNTIAGWTSPANQPVDVVNGQTASAGGLYIQQTGSLTVTLSPTEAITAGAQWNVDGGTWQNSGDTVAGLSAGSHKVTFKPVTGWNTPAVLTVSISNAQTTTKDVPYVQQTGSLTVTITPAAAVKAGAMWCVTAAGSEDCGKPTFTGPWQTSGATVKNLTAGSHTVGFNIVTGWTPPESQTLKINLGHNSWHSLWFIYQLPSFGPTSAKCGHLSGGCTASPCECGTYCPSCDVEKGLCDYFQLDLFGTACGAVGAQFTAQELVATPQVDCGKWSRGSGNVINGDGPAFCVRNRGEDECAHVQLRFLIMSLPGEHACDGNLGSIQSQFWGEVVEPSGKKTGPEFISDKVYWLASSIHCSGSGKPTCGFLTVTISPADAVSAGAQWNVDGGAWQNSGATVPRLSAGTHTVNFNTIPGWTSPASKPVNIVVGQTASASGLYVKQTAPPTMRPISTTCNSNSSDVCLSCCNASCAPCNVTYGIDIQGQACGQPGAVVTYGYTPSNFTSMGTFPQLLCGLWDKVGNTCLRGASEPSCANIDVYGTAFGDCNTHSINPWAEVKDSGGDTGQVHLWTSCCQGGMGGTCPPP